MIGFLRNIRDRLRGRRPGVHYLVEGAGWVIRRVGEAIIGNLTKVAPSLRLSIRENPLGLYHQVVHFGSVYCLKGHFAEAHPSNTLVSTVYHHSETYDPNSRAAFDVFRAALPKLDAVVTASRGTAADLRAMGITDRLHVIPLGVDLDVFRRRTPDERIAQRKALGIPEDALCIGSFQKDGVGWEDGNEPKLIKGPDVFVEVVSRLAKRFTVFVLLTGPARGFVKHGLDKAGVSYRHDFLGDYTALADYYTCLDLCLVTSRVEGGPKALLESTASGVPLVTTCVGMAPDILRSGHDALITDVDDVDALVDASARVLSDASLSASLVRHGLVTAAAYGWPDIARRYYEEVYAPLL